MSPRMCEFFMCGKRQNEYPNLKMFNFPVDDSVTLRKWVLHSGNRFLRHLNKNQLQTCLICELHFPETAFYDFKRSKLRPQAVPIHFSSITTPGLLEMDPLQIELAANVPIFGNNMDNIEIVVESDDEIGASASNTTLAIPVNLDDENTHIISAEDVISLSGTFVNGSQLSEIDLTDYIHDVIAEDIDMDEPCFEIITKDEEGIQVTHIAKRVNMEILGAHNEENQLTSLIDLTNTVDEAVIENIEVLPPPLVQISKQNNISTASQTQGLQIKVLEPFEKNQLCYVPNCNIHSSNAKRLKQERILYFSVPTDENLKKIWDIAIGRKDKRLAYNNLVCHQHFQKEDIIHTPTVANNDNEVMLHSYRKWKLRQGAVPCLKFHEECCVPICRKKTGKMYCFPVIRYSDFDLWLYMIKNTGLKKMKMEEVIKYRVCERHFEPDCFKNEFLLKQSAAPTLLLPEVYMQLATKDVQTDHSNITVICAYGECTNQSGQDKNLYKFPTNIDRCLLWLKACGRHDLITQPIDVVKKMCFKKLGVCEDHFDTEQFDGIDILKSDAVPKTCVESDSDIRESKAFSTKNNESKEVPRPSNVLEEIGLSQTFYVETKKVAGSKMSNPGQVLDVQEVLDCKLKDGAPLRGLCCYVHCNNTPSTENPFFDFPSDIKRCETWLKACGQPNLSAQYIGLNYKNIQVCSKHFEDDMFDEANRLKNDAVPIMFNVIKKKKLETQEVEKKSTQPEKKTVNEEEINTAKEPTKEIKRLKSKSIHSPCALEDCSNVYNMSTELGAYHKFPDPFKDQQRFNVWVKLVANKDLYTLSYEEVYTKYMVCERHFDPLFYKETGKLSPLSIDAVPTRNLTENNEWFFNSIYYQTKLQKKWPMLHKYEEKMKCVLEKDQLHFPGIGYYLSPRKRTNSKSKNPYKVYKRFSTVYGLNREVDIGESMKFHTAIVIDDDDDVEKEVLQLLLDKRKKV